MIVQLLLACNASAPPQHGSTPATVAPSPALFPALCLTELVADNVTSAADAAGQHPDWVEVHNPTPETVSLEGWSLSDAGGGSLRLDVQPVLQPWEHRVVFLYDGGPRLSAGGDSVTLRAPDGTEHSLAFGPLAADMAAFRDGAGCEAPWSTRLGGSPGEPNRDPVWTPRIASGSTVRWHSDPPADWADPDFDDGDWAEGPAGVPQGTERLALRWHVPRPARGRVSLAVAFADGVRVWLDGAEVYVDHLDDDGQPPESLMPPRLGAWRGSLHDVEPLGDSLVVAAEAVAFDLEAGGAWLDLRLDAAEDP